MHLNYGVFPILYQSTFPIVCLPSIVYITEERHPDWPTDVDNRIAFGIEMCKDRGFVRPGDLIIVVTGWRQGLSTHETRTLQCILHIISGAGFTNTIRIIMAP